MYLLPDFLSSQGAYFKDYTLVLVGGETIRCFDVQGGGATVNVQPIGSRERVGIPSATLEGVIDNGTGEVLSVDETIGVSGGTEMLRQRSMGRSRGADKSALAKLFRYPIIRHFYRFRLVEEFGSKCFNCAADARLIEVSAEFAHRSGGLLRFANIDLDHHFPFELGGRFEYGNLVPLCKTCNSKKSDQDPRIFYEEPELSDLVDRLNRQRDEFDFHLEWDYINERRFREYFEKLGIPSHLIDCAIVNEEHDYYIF